MMKTDNYRVPVEKLKRFCTLEDELDFCKDIQEVLPLDDVIGQERAVRSMQFGLAMDAQGYNIFVVGPPGTGKSTYVEAIVVQEAAKGTVPADWCYINNFINQDRPLAVSLPAGQGRIFQKDMEELVDDLKVVIPKAFESSNYEQQKDSIVQIVQKKMEEHFQLLEKEAQAVGFSLKQAPGRVIFIPVKDGKMLGKEDYDKLTPEEMKTYDVAAAKLRKRMEEIFNEGRLQDKKAAEQIAALEKEISLNAASPLFSVLKEKYKDNPKILDYLDTVSKNISNRLDIFKSPEGKAPAFPFMAPQEGGDNLASYKVNLFVTNEKTEGAPVVIESSPYFYNLLGKVEYRNQMMSYMTDFTMVKPGAIHRANGGYLILQAKDLLMDPFAWDGLKKALKYRQAVIENMGEQYRIVPTATLRPEPIPLDVKVILIGSPLFYLYFSMDEDFQKLFKVKVDFDIEMPRTPESLRQYVSYVKAICKRENTIDFNQIGLARIIEFGSYLAGNQNKLSTRFNELTEIVYEAINLATREGAPFVDASHVDKAIAERRYRSNKLEEKIQEYILQEKILIDLEGAKVGQINGLAIIDFGGFSFGHPTRITAQTYMGREGIINIERETKMSGTSHTKGVLTLTGYLGGKLAQEKPLGLTAQITFEQNYSGIDGDSASSAELYAILSSLSGVPLKQNLAVTGSVNQFGEIQPIGDVTGKIEGFFDLCNFRGLTGEQGVLIPARNIDNLMLKEAVIQAVKENRFHIYAVKTIDEGIAILSGIPAGHAEPDGKYTEGSIFWLADSKLRAYDKGLSAGSREAGKNRRIRKDSKRIANEDAESKINK